MKVKTKLAAIAPLDSFHNRRSFDKETCNLYYQEDVSSYNDVVIASSSIYEKLFGSKRNAASGYLKHMSVIKIERTDAQGKRWAIYRKFRPCDINDFDGSIAVSYHSLLFLKDSDGSILGEEVYLSKSCWAKYLWHHPNEVVVSSFMLGLISLILGIVSILISIFKIPVGE